MNASSLLAPEQALADGFARRVVQWARERGASDQVRDALHTAARATSLATASGHVCTYLADVDQARDLFSEQRLRDALLESGMVGTAQAPDVKPLILDEDGRIYLHRYFDYERRLAVRLMQHSGGATNVLSAEIRRLIERLFAENRKRLGGRPDWQRIATTLALAQRLTIISGGPGTGKTTTVVNILACALTANPDCRVALAAPTGKAASRMREAIRAGSAHLPEELRRRLPTESFTIHRLLEVLPDARGFRYHADNPLPIDLVVVDEASMLDLALATKLLEAVPVSAHIILLGDKDQLAAVEAGAVFSELSAHSTLSRATVEHLSVIDGIAGGELAGAAPLKPHGLDDCVVWLTENFRFASDSGIGRLAAHVNTGDASAAIALLRAGAGHGLEWIEDGQPEPQAATRQRIVDGIKGYVAAARADLGDKAALFEAFGRFRVLCAEREGPRGVAEINRFIGQHVRRELDHAPAFAARSEWYSGRPVMVLRNDYALDLFNGDVGIALPDADGTLQVYFPESVGGFRDVAPLRLPEHETAFATTVHKAQGLEFDDMLLMLPARTSRVVTRELVYTAITRSRSRVTIAGSAEVLETGIRSPTRRCSGLLARLKEIRTASQ